MIQAVLFDMDGTLIDTEKYYRIFWPKALAACGYTMIEFEQSGLIAELDALHADIDNDDSGDERRIGIRTEEEQQP